MKFICLLLVAAAAIFASDAFTIVPTHRGAAVQSSSALSMTVLVYNGKKKNFKAGSPLSTAVAQLGVPVKYSCKK
jgi:hypothetical protein